MSVVDARQHMNEHVELPRSSARWGLRGGHHRMASVRVVGERDPQHGEPAVPEFPARDGVLSVAIVVARSAADDLAEAYDRAFPLEVAGFLLGVHPGREMLATKLTLARRSAGGRGEFNIPAHELRRIKALARDRRLQLLALVHSHPSGNNRLT